MTAKEAADLVRDAFDMWEKEWDCGEDWSDVHEARDMAISALEAQERTESLYQMDCERIDAVYTEPSKYDLGRISALADATGHVMQAFNPD